MGIWSAGSHDAGLIHSTKFQKLAKYQKAQIKVSCSSRQPRSVYHPPWPDMLGCIWSRSERAPSAVESVELAERDQMLGGASRSCWGPDGIQEPVEATGGSENSVAQYLPIRLLF